jgi:phospholipase C
MRKLFVLAAALILAALPTVPAAATPVGDTPTATPIKHVVWIMQDNHSFDNYFGTYPGADGIPQGVCQRVNLNRRSTVGCVQPFHLGDTPVEDLSQGPGIQRRQYNNGQMDGFVAAYRRLGRDGTSAMGYYDGSDIPFHWNTADQYVLFDRFFSSTTVGYREAYLYWLAGQAPAGPTPLDSSAGYDALPTVFDRLAKRQISARFYVENLDEAATSADQAGVRRSSQLIKVPLLSMKRFRDGGELAGQVVDLNQYYDDLRNGTLPAVSYIVTTGSSENPPADPAAGSRILRRITGELMRSSSWATSALMWTYDGWGGWYDHVPPPRVDSHGYGFRVPALLVSPYAKRGVVDHTVLDYTAMLKFIESNWQLAPLSTRDQQSAGLISAFDFSAPARPPVLPASTWPGPQESLSAENPAPVIYSVYGVAAALAIMVLSFAFRGWPIPAPIGRAVVLVRSWFEPLLRRPLRGLHATQTRGAPARRSAPFYDWRRATLAVPRWPRPAVAIEDEEAWAGWSPEIMRIPAGHGLVGTIDGGKELAEGEPDDIQDYRTRVEDAQDELAAADVEDADTAEVEPAAADVEKADTAPAGRQHDGTVKIPAVLAVSSGGGHPHPQLAEQQVLGPVPVQTPAEKRRFGSLIVAATALAALLIGALLFAASRDRGVTAQSVPTVTATAAATASMPTSEPPNESTDTAGQEATIQLEDVPDSAMPFQTVRIQGTYHGGANAFMRVQRWEGGKWLEFPLPMKTDRSGQFTAYVEPGQPGRYRLRVVDPDSGVTSKPFVLVING